MKIYIQDNDWCGSIIVIANNESDARARMENAENYDANIPVQENEIREGFMFYNLGDM